ncbi:MAG: exodeoxyribonuclease VII small subunit [Armatimonadota bacterium]
MSSDMKDVQKLSFEEALDELEKIVEELEGGQVELERMLDRFERAMALRAHCATLLSDAETRIEQLVNERGDTESLNPQGERTSEDSANPDSQQSVDGPDAWTMAEDEDPFGDQ